MKSNSFMSYIIVRRKLLVMPPSVPISTILKSNDIDASDCKGINSSEIGFAFMIRLALLSPSGLHCFDFSPQV